MKELKQSDLKSLRQDYVKLQNNVCPICKVCYQDDEFVVDHKHAKKTEELGKDGAGLVRGVLCKYCNVLIAKTENNFVRYGFHKRGIDISVFAKGMAEYFENPPLLPLNLLHPSERRFETIGKRDFNRLNKWYKEKYGKELKYPYKGKITKPIKKALEEYNKNL